MAFKVKVNGKVVATINERVDYVSLRSAKGEAGKVGCGDIDEVDIVVEGPQPAGTKRLEDIDAEKVKEQRALATKKAAVKKAATKKG